MRRFLIPASLAASALLAIAAPAQADYRHRGHHHGGSHVGFYFGVPGPYYYGYPYYGYPPRTVVYERPVYERPVYTTVAPGGVTIREGRDSAGNYCREYQSNTTIDGRPVPTYGTACLRPDGQWQIIN